MIFRRLQNKFPPISLNIFNLILSIWFGVALNLSFYMKMMQLTPYQGIKAWLFLMATVIVVVSIYNLIFQLLQWKWNIRSFAVIFILLGGFSAYFVNSLGIGISADLMHLLIFGCVLLNYLIPEDALGHLMYVVVGALVLNWAMITLTHLKFKDYIQKNGILSKFPALFSPLSNYIVLVFIAVVLYIMWTQGFKESVLMLPIWVVLMLVLYKILKPRA